MLQIGMIVKILPDAEYSGKFTGYIGKVKNYFSQNKKVGVELFQQTNDASSKGLFWFSESKVVAAGSLPDAMMEYKITEGSAEKFVAGIIKRGHEAVLEHCSFTVKFICDRGVSHEIVRHRMASYCQESTRYCNYGKGKFGEEITVIEPCFLEPGSRAYDYWRDACEGVEIRYFDMLAEGCTPQEARSVLPNSLKTEVVMTANIREWRHFLKLRCSPAAHPQMREVALILLDKVHWLIPVCFDDIWSEYHADV